MISVQSIKQVENTSRCWRSTWTPLCANRLDITLLEVNFDDFISNRPAVVTETASDGTTVAAIKMLLHQEEVAASSSFPYSLAVKHVSRAALQQALGGTNNIEPEASCASLHDFALSVALSDIVTESASAAYLAGNTTQ